MEPRGSRYDPRPTTTRLVLVVAARPVLEVAAAPLRRAVEQLPRAVQHVCAAVVARVGVVDDPVLERERAQAMQLIAPDVEVGSPWRAEVEAFTGSSLLLGEHGEIHVEVASEGRDPREAPAHSPLVRVEPLERSTGRGHEGHVAVLEVGDGAVGVIRHERAARAALRVLRAEHEVEDEKLRASVEQLRQSFCARIRPEGVLLVDPHPRERAPLLGEFVTAPGQLLLLLQQLLAFRQPRLTGSDFVLCQRNRLPWPNWPFLLETGESPRTHRCQNAVRRPYYLFLHGKATHPHRAPRAGHRRSPCRPLV